MDLTTFDRIALTAACVAAAALLALRLHWHKKRSGASAIAFFRRRAGSPLEMALGACWAVLMLAVPAWVAIYAWKGPDSVGVVPLGDFTAAANVAGWTLLAAGGALIGVAQTQMGASWRVGIDDAATELVTRGSFALVRNPIYTGMVAALAGWTLVAPTVVGASVAMATAIGVALQARIEEKHLLALHGEAYRDYARRVGRFLPGVGRL